MTLNSAKLHFMYDQLFFLFVFNVYTTFEKYNKYKVKTKQTNKEDLIYLLNRTYLLTWFIVAINICFWTVLESLLIIKAF